MLTCMRTTLVIDDATLRKAKRAAAEAGCTLSELVNQALCAALAKRREPRSEFQMVVYGGPLSATHQPQDFKDAIEADDAETVGH